MRDRLIKLRLTSILASAVRTRDCRARLDINNGSRTLLNQSKKMRFSVFFFFFNHRS